MSTNSNPSVQWLQDLKTQLGALWESLNQLQADYDLAKANLNSLDANSTDPAIIQQRQQAISLVQQAETALNAERQSLIGLQGQYQQASNACEAALRRIREEQDKAFNISRSAEGVSKGITELSEAYGSVLKVMSLCGIETEKLAVIQQKLNDINTITTAIQKVSTVFSSQSAFQTQIVSRVTSAWGTAQRFLNTQLGLTVKASKLFLSTVGGALVAVVGVLIGKYVKWKQEQEEIARKQKEFTEQVQKYNNKIADAILPQVQILKTLQYQWNLLGNNLQGKNKFIRENREEFAKLGVEINNLVDAEKLLVNNSEDVLRALILRAQASSVQELAVEEFKKIITAQSNIDRYEDMQPDDSDLLNKIKNKNKERKLPFPKPEIKDFTSTNDNVPAVPQLANKTFQQVTDEAHQMLIDDATQAKENAEAAAKSLGDKYQNLMNESDNILKKLGIFPKPKKDNPNGNQKELENEINSIKNQNNQTKLDLIRQRETDKRKVIEAEYEAEKELIRKKEQELIKLNGDKPLSGEALTVINTSYDIAEQRKIAKENDLVKETEKELTNLMESYQDYTDKRLATEKKFNDDIATMQKARAKAEKDGNTSKFEQLSRSIAHATKEKGITLATMDMGQLKKTPEYIKAFKNLEFTSEETLNSLLDQLRISKKYAEEVLSPEQLEEYNKSIQTILDEFVSRNPYQALIDRKEELAFAERELANAKRDLDNVNAGKKVVKTTKYNKESGKIEPATYLSAAEAAERYAKAQKKVAKSSNDVKTAQNEIRKELDELFAELKKLGSALGGQAGEILIFINDIYTFVNTAIDGIQKVGEVGAKSLSMVEKASVILAIVSAAIQLLKKLSSFLPDSHEDYLKYAAKIQEINKLRDAVTEYEIAVLKARQAEKGWFAEDGMGSLKDAYKMNQKIKDAYFEKATEEQAIYQNKSGGGWLTKAVEWVWNSSPGGGSVFGKLGKEYKEGNTAAVNNLRIETRKAKKGFLGSGIGGKSQKTEDLTSWTRNNLGMELFDSEGFINKNAANIVLEKYGNKLQGETKATLEELVKLKDQYDEYKQQLRDYVNSLYEPIVDNFVDSLWSWFDEGKDALDSFKEHASETFRNIVSDMMRTIIMKNVVGTFGDDIQELYKKYAETDEMSESQLMDMVAQRTDKLMQDYEKNIPTLQNMMTTLSNSMENVGIDLRPKDEEKKDSSQQGTSRGFETMSQETGSELNGRFTALQMAGETIRLETALQTQLLTGTNTRLGEIYTVNASILNVADDTRNTIVNSYLELQEIRENTGAIVKPIKEMVSDIKEIKDNTSRL